MNKLKKLILSILFLLIAVAAYADSAKQVDFILSGYRHPATDQVLGGGKIYTFLDGTSTLSPLWTDKNKGGSATNPVILDSSGKAEVYGDNIYKFEIYDSGDNLIETLTGLEYKVVTTAAPVDTITDLRASTDVPFANQEVSVLGYYTPGDGGGQPLYWDSTSTETDNGFTVFKVASIATGRFKSVDVGTLNVRHAGAKGDGVTNDTASFTVFQNLYPLIVSSPGVYLLSSFTLSKSLNISENCSLKPDGAATLTVNADINAGYYKIFETGWTFTETTSVSREHAKADWFDIDNTGVLDIYANAQYAIDFCEDTRTGALLFGAGFYTTYQTLLITKSVAIRGQGPIETTLFGHTSMASQAPILQYNGGGTSIRDIIIGDMAIRDLGANRVRGIKAQFLNLSTVRDLVLVNLEVGLDLADNNWGMQYDRVICQSVGTPVILGDQDNDTTFNKCVLTGTVNGVTMTSGGIDTLTFNECDWEGMTAPPITLTNPIVRNLNINNCRFEACVGGLALAPTVLEGFYIKGSNFNNTANNTTSYIDLRNANGGSIRDNFFGLCTVSPVGLSVGSNKNIIITNNANMSGQNMTGRPNGSAQGSDHSQCYNNTGSPTIGDGSIVPTTGTYTAGSVINDITGATNGWRCTVGGTPGTWVAR